MTFADDPIKQARVIALIHCQVETGLAIRDTVQLEREHIREGLGGIRDFTDRRSDKNYSISTRFGVRAAIR